MHTQQQGQETSSSSHMQPHLAARCRAAHMRQVARESALQGSKPYPVTGDRQLSQMMTTSGCVAGGACKEVLALFSTRPCAVVCAPMHSTSMYVCDASNMRRARLQLRQVRKACQVVCNSDADTADTGQAVESQIVARSAPAAMARAAIWAALPAAVAACAACAAAPDAAPAAAAL